MSWKGFRDIRATIEIDLTKSEEELWNGLDKDARWGVNKAKKGGLKVGLTDDNNLWEKFYEVYKETCKYGNIVPLDSGEIKKGKLFACFKDNKLIAGAVVKEDEKIELFLNASNHDFLKFQPNNLLYWSIIKWAKKNRYKTFDLGGYQLNAKKGNKLYEINRFKLRWGGEIKEYPVYSKNIFYILGRKIIRNCGFVKKARDNLRVWKNQDKFS